MVRRAQDRFARDHSESDPTRTISAEGSSGSKQIRTAPQREQSDTHDLRRGFAAVKTNSHGATARALRHARSPQRVRRAQLFHLPTSCQLFESYFTCQLLMPTFRELLHLPTSHASFSRVTSPANFSCQLFGCYLIILTTQTNFSALPSHLDFSGVISLS